MSFTFALTAPSPHLPIADWVESLRRLEAIGFDEVVMADHFTDGYDTEPMVALTAAAMATDRLRLRPAVLGVDYRHPVLVHRMAATLDVVSEGRLTLGIGAGWMTSDYEAAGIDIDEPGVRVSRLEEAIAVVKGLFGPTPFSFDGDHYSIRELDGLPKPVQLPHPPFFVGGGSPRVLRLAGREAAVVGVNAGLRAGVLGRHAVVDFMPERVKEKIGWAYEGAARVGKSPDDITLSMNCWLVRVTPDVTSATEFLDRMAAQFDITGTELDASPACSSAPSTTSAPSWRRHVASTASVTSNSTPDSTRSTSIRSRRSSPRSPGHDVRADERYGSIPGILRTNAPRFSDRDAVVDGERRVTYAELGRAGGGRDARGDGGRYRSRRPRRHLGTEQPRVRRRRARHPRRRGVVGTDQHAVQRRRSRVRAAEERRSRAVHRRRLPRDRLRRAAHPHRPRARRVLPYGDAVG